MSRFVNAPQAIAHLRAAEKLATEASYFLVEPSPDGALLTPWSHILGGLADTLGAAADQLEDESEGG